MINNRQNGRRRGRGGGPRTPNNAPNAGNRQDNRSRGNAAQLHEKYKALARDAQLAGDRVQTEYYLQFADHYYRVLGENRARFEDQRPRRDDFMDEDEDGEEMAASDQNEGEGRRFEREQRPERFERNDRPDRSERGDREPRFQREGRGDGERQERADRQERSDRQPRADFAEQPMRDDEERGGASEVRSRRGRPRREASNDEGERISLEVLPPAIAPSVADEGDDAPKPARRRTVRRPRPDGETDIAPAA